MRTLLATSRNQCILQTFDMYKDKILYFVVLYRTVNSPNRPYTSRKLYSEVYARLIEGNITGAKLAFVEAMKNNREELVRYM